MPALLEVEDLSVAFETEGGTVDVIDRVNFDIEPGETVGLVGESGCGKSVTALSIMGLLPRPSGRVTGGDIRLEGQSLTSLTSKEFGHIRGNRMAMIFQEPMTALNPVQRIGDQLVESYALHRSDLSAAEVNQSCLALLDRVGIAGPDQRMTEYPHELSGGLRQRVMIAMALSCRPQILIADEPTTALDVTIQAQILELLRELQRDFGMSMIFITHDLGVIAELASRVIVMYAGRIAESADVVSIFEKPRHPYTRGLLKSIPRLDDKPKTVLDTIQGAVPGFGDMPSACRFSNRCAYVAARCRDETPDLASAGSGHKVACHHWRSVVVRT